MQLRRRRRTRRPRRQLRESLELIRTFRGYAWSQWFSQNFPTLLTLMAALLGSGSPLVKGGQRRIVLAGVARVARPVDRHARSVGLAELFVLALAPSLAFARSRRSSASSSPRSRRSSTACPRSSARACFFGLAVFLSTLFNDVWRPLLLTCVGALAIARRLLPYEHGLFQAMGGRSYFFEGTLAWPELLVSAAAAAGLVYAAAARHRAAGLLINPRHL